MRPRGPYSPLAWVLALPVRAWRSVSRWLPARCRFHPSCSAYALEALQVHGGIRGGALAARRVARCHPWNPGGFDPVPGRTEANKCLHGSRRPGPASTI